MARICIALTPEDAKLAPREYALLKQLGAGPDSSIDAQVWASLAHVLTQLKCVSTCRQGHSLFTPCSLAHRSAL